MLDGVAGKSCESSIPGSPGMTAVEALWTVHAKKLTAFRARPPDPVFAGEPLYSNGLDALHIFDDAHAVPGLIALYQALHPNELVGLSMSMRPRA